jgi:arylsulfatase A-like enzyme
MGRAVTRRAGSARLRCAAIAASALLAAGLAASCGRDEGAAAAGQRRDLLLISLDTLRADRLGAYGYARATSPALDALAAAGVRFESVFAESNWTLPSHVTLFTGLPPALHGVRLPGHRLGNDVPTLAEVLRGAGFRTVAFTGLGFLDRRFGFARGFEHYADQALDLASGLDATLRVIARLRPEERFFAFVHAYDVHCPYDPPPPYARAFETQPPAHHLETRGRCGEPHFNAMQLTPQQARFLSDRYDASIRHADDLIAVFLDRLRADGRLATTLVCLVSDHGEEFLEHGRIGHRDTLHVQSLHVPWILSGPGLAPRVVREPAGLADVMPTLLELLGVPGPTTQGRSLAGLVLGRGAAEEERPIFSENDWNTPLRSAVVGSQHLIASPGTGELRLFDWRSDPDEQTDVSGRDPDRSEALRELLAAHERALDARGRREPLKLARPAESQLERLRALGYVE